ncbi:hypothetical protein [Sedimentibacter sp. MB31-C6]|uniref:hypothetical protein n=1 Tax=Sedimentibacter sp. MB31-C6 TaxID=3109366 RepID=UPI002DDD16B0|nr:hypothetical protein [Sedimentibacter sp. MB36-C1]WSI03733.1 hypothetical protein U8307_11820 [Sedimentibacter sp. MB36-C1]
MKKLLKSNKIDAMLPIYLDDLGNCTEIITSAESFIKTVTIETCVKNLADYYNISLFHNRINYGAELGITNKVPVVINDELIYIYINVRKPLLDHDAAYGFIDVNSIEEEFKENGKAAILMKSGRVIQTRQSIQSLKRAMLNARLAKDIYKERHHK